MNKKNIKYLILTGMYFLFSFHVFSQENAKSCIDCHKKLIVNKKLHPAAEDCSTCHTETGNKHPLAGKKGFSLIEKLPDLCYECHERKDTEKYKHPPAEEGECMMCHSAHASEYNALLKQNPTSKLCFECHDSEIPKKSVVHSPFKDGKCENCHNPHQSNNSKFLIADNSELCFKCHNKTIKTETKNIENIALKIKKGKSIHAPIEIDGCGTCHKPHFSENSFLLNFKYPNQKYVSADTKNFALCFECHDSELISAKYTKTATNFRDGEKNMHFLHINGEKGRNCNLCHDIHASGNLFLIKEKVKFGNWEMNMNYKTTPAGGSCFPGCHGKKEYNRKKL